MIRKTVKRARRFSPDYQDGKANDGNLNDEISIEDDDCDHLEWQLLNELNNMHKRTANIQRINQKLNYTQKN